VDTLSVGLKITVCQARARSFVLVLPTLWRLTNLEIELRSGGRTHRSRDEARRQQVRADASYVTHRRADLPPSSRRALLSWTALVLRFADITNTFARWLLVWQTLHRCEYIYVFATAWMCARCRPERRAKPFSESPRTCTQCSAAAAAADAAHLPKAPASR